MTALCVLPHPPTADQPPPTATIGLICGDHRAELDDLTADITDLWLDLEARDLLPAAKPPSDGSKPTKASHEPEPINLGLLALRDRRNSWATEADDIPSVHVIVSAWLNWIAPNTATGVMVMLGVLPRYHDGIASSTRVEDYWHQMTHLRSTLKGTLGIATHVDAGLCPDCAGRMTRKHASHIVRCNACHRTHGTPRQLSELAVRQHKATL